MTRRFVAGLVGALLIATGATADEPPWILNSRGAKALTWVAQIRDATLKNLQSHPDFATFERESAAILTDSTRIADVSFIGQDVYQHWQDRDRPLGVWRRTAKSLFLAGKPDWDTIIDLDALSAIEKTTWILKDADCRGRRCLVRLSVNGRDAAVTREFDLDTKQFVAGGFTLAESKTQTWWRDDDTLLVAEAADQTRGHFLPAPRTLKIWRRGAPLSSAKTILVAEPADVAVGATLVGAGPDGAFLAFRSLDPQRRAYQIVRSDGSRHPAALPDFARLYGVNAGHLLVSPINDWPPADSDKIFPAGSIVAVPLSDLFKDGSVARAEMVLAPEKGQGVRGVINDRARLFVDLLRDNVSCVVELTRFPAGWVKRDVPVPSEALVTPLRLIDGRMLAKIEAPLIPPRLALIDTQSGAEEVLFSQARQFEATGLVSERWRTTSEDGTEVAYLIVRHASTKPDGTNPTLIYGYGGYGVPLTPRYEPIFGKLWLERGGVYVHAYLRGGGEYGPAWWRETLGKGRLKPIQDMIAVVRDLQRRGISSPPTTGIIGRSEGGLMTAAVMQRAPELMNAVVIGGPLLDLLNLDTLPEAGPWSVEHGHPRDPEMAAFIRTYSPMQNVAGRDKAYPLPLIITSTDDDRVLPGVARRFSMRLTDKGHDNLYFEDDQGGHYWELAGPPVGDWRQRARARAVEFSYLWRQLGQK